MCSQRSAAVADGAFQDDSCLYVSAGPHKYWAHVKNICKRKDLIDHLTWGSNRVEVAPTWPVQISTVCRCVTFA